MVRVWYLDDKTDDQRLPHMTDPPHYVDLDTLKDCTGIIYFKIDADGYEKDETLTEIRETRGYNYDDMIEVTKNTPNYENMIKMFFVEHLHADEEIRLILAGSGYFDVRDTQDKWLRVEVEKGDMIVLPAGIYHRFTLDTKDYVKAVRYFSGVPVWKAFNRPNDEHPARLQYEQQLKTGFVY